MERREEKKLNQQFKTESVEQQVTKWNFSSILVHFVRIQLSLDGFIKRAGIFSLKWDGREKKMPGEKWRREATVQRIVRTFNKFEEPLNR